MWITCIHLTWITSWCESYTVCALQHRPCVLCNTDSVQTACTKVAFQCVTVLCNTDSVQTVCALQHKQCVLCNTGSVCSSTHTPCRLCAPRLHAVCVADRLRAQRQHLGFWGPPHSCAPFVSLPHARRVNIVVVINKKKRVCTESVLQTDSVHGVCTESVLCVAEVASQCVTVFCNTESVHVS